MVSRGSFFPSETSDMSRLHDPRQCAMRFNTAKFVCSRVHSYFGCCCFSPTFSVRCCCVSVSSVASMCLMCVQASCMPSHSVRLPRTGAHSLMLTGLIDACGQENIRVGFGLLGLGHIIIYMCCTRCTQLNKRSESRHAHATHPVCTAYAASERRRMRSVK